MRSLLWVKVMLSLMFVGADLGAAEGRVDTESKRRDSKGIRLEVGPGFSFSGDEVGYGVTTGAAFRVAKSVPLYLGVDLAFHVWDYVTGSFSDDADYVGDVTTYHFLATVLYRIELGRFNPYFGMSIGPTVRRSSVRIESFLDSTEVDSESDVYLELLGRAGLDMQFTHVFGLALESKAGILDNQFIIYPQANLTFSF